MAKRVRPPPQDDLTNSPARHGVSAQHERLVGRLIIEWSKLEGTMQETLWTLMDIKWEDGRVITHTMDATKKLQLLRTFSKRHLIGDQLDLLTNTFDCMEEYQEDRNVIAHGSWGTLVESGEPIVMSLRRKTQPDKIVTEGFPSWRMYQIIDGIKICRTALIVWRERHEALPDRRSPPLHDAS